MYEDSPISLPRGPGNWHTIFWGQRKKCRSPHPPASNCGKHLPWKNTVCTTAWSTWFLNSLFATFADLHVRKLTTFADLHSYTQAYCSFVLLNEAITIVSGSHCAHGWHFGFCIRFTGKKYSELKIVHVLPKWPPIPVNPKIMWHTGGWYVANKELIAGSIIAVVPQNIFYW